MARLSAASRLSSTTSTTLGVDDMPRSTAQMRAQKFRSPVVGEACRRRVIMRSAGPRERMVHSRVAVKRNPRVVLQRSHDALAGGRRGVLILFSQVQRKWVADITRFAEQILDSDAVIAHAAI